MSATEHTTAQSRVAPGVTMHALLASCAAARLVSTPPREPDPGTRQRTAGTLGSGGNGGNGGNGENTGNTGNTGSAGTVRKHREAA
ncbi:hypothetical protein ACFOOM_05035 [Streptomyces echinoruber]|uniref:Uncharacterized protein n=1 Tax=Streptomyces echinoruber TaxID=68898 RepID=A0A918R9Q6_9ACTN|nr:hypothetical protein [Streptomyces echinoruber]GGZ90814.1 hypothetical protein GCM10010389_31570 [Streptomyces echinoruber]